MRKIIICMDGTGNEIGDRETNILKIYKALDKSAKGKTPQFARYVMGVGTYDGPHLMGRLKQRVQGVLGLAFGLGLEDDVLDAYRYLCRTYQSAEAKRKADTGLSKAAAEDDQIYLFGFSRGAYAARVLAGFIHNFGLVDEDRLHLIVPVFRAYRRVTDHDRDIPADTVFQALREYEKVLNPDQSVPIRFLGLFDTVSSIIRFRRPFYNFRKFQSFVEFGTHASVQSNVSVRIIAHALAIDERRTMFRALKWGLPGKDAGKYYGNNFRNPGSERIQYVAQRWFPGFHSDIGGSPSEDRSGIGKITVNWMLDWLAEAEKQADAEDNTIRKAGRKPVLPGGTRRQKGLKLRRGARDRYLLGKDSDMRTPGGLPYAQPDPLAPIHPSIFDGWKPRGSWIWAVLEVIPKSLKRREKGDPTWFRRGLIWYLPLMEPRTIPEGHAVDDSAYDRQKDADSLYAPPNLPARKGD